MRKNTPAAALVLALGVAVWTAPVALAQTAYKAEDIIKHFNTGGPQLGASRGVVAPGLGQGRGVCFGVEANCPGNAAAAAATSTSSEAIRPVAAFDLVVKFKYNSDVLEPSAKKNLDEFAKALRDPTLARRSFLVEGHTDATGTPDYNLNLSERRARAVVRYLSEKGVDTGKLVARGYGESKPLVADRFAGDNRRVETRLQLD